jgi:hypothetical protein
LLGDIVEHHCSSFIPPPAQADPPLLHTVSVSFECTVTLS